jgi:hypothetical protein
MATPRRKPIGIIVVAIVAAAIACWCGVVRLNVLTPFVCFPPADQAAMIEKFESDPLYATAPTDGRLIEESATNYECDNGHGGSPLSPLFAQVTRLYTTPELHHAAQLHLMFDQAAAAAGWVVVAQSDDRTDYANVRYCKAFGERVADAWVQSRTRVVPEIEVTLDARVNGTTCSTPVNS